jgi:hypothetical protein
MRMEQEPFQPSGSGEAATVGDSARFVMTNFPRRSDRPYRRGNTRATGAFGVSETLARLSASSGVVVLLLAATLLALLARPALLDGVAVLARPEPGLAGIGIGVVGDLRLLRHFNLRW